MLQAQKLGNTAAEILFVHCYMISKIFCFCSRGNLFPDPDDLWD